MKTPPINYPCVMLELHENPRIIGDLKKVRYNLIMNKKDFFEKKETYLEPIICHYYPVINKAVEILGLKFCNRTKTYIKK